MPWFTAFMLYVVIWWVVLFAVLPIGVRPVVDADSAPGGWRGAPEHPHLVRKMIATTLLAALAWGGTMLLIRSDWLNFRTGWLAIHDE